MSAEDQISQFAERIVRLEEERKALANDIKDVKAEAKAAGFSPKLIATCVRIMLMEAEKRAEALSGHEELDLYLGAVGLIARRGDDEIAAPQERLAGHPAADRSPASNPGDRHVDRGASAQPCSMSLPTEAQAGRRWGEVAFWEAQSATDRMPSGADTGSDVGTVAQVSRDSASGLSARPARAVGQTEIVRGTIEPLPLATGSATPACVLSGDAVRGGSSGADTEGPETKSGVTAGESPGPYQIRPNAAGSSAEVFWTGAIPIEPQGLRTAQAGHAREIGGSVWATVHSAARP